MNKFAIVAALFAAAQANAQNTLTHGTSTLFEGNTNRGTFATHTACVDAARLRVIAAFTAYQCRENLSVQPGAAPPPPPPPGPRVSYTTTFNATEYPISEGGNWAHANNPWKYVLTEAGIARGFEVNSGYNDSYAYLTGQWGADQTVEATIVRTGTTPSGPSTEAILLLRVTDDTNNVRAYEALFDRSGSAYFMRWNGPYSSFTPLSYTCPSGTLWHASTPLVSGDKIKATITGNHMRAWINEKLMYCATDNTFASGSPGMAFFVGPGGNLRFLNITDLKATSN